MKRLIFIIFYILFLSVQTAYGQMSYLYPRIEETDGDPTGILVKLKFPPGSLSHVGGTWTILDMGSEFTGFNEQVINGINTKGLQDTIGFAWTDLGQQAGEQYILAICSLGRGICLAGTYPTGKILRSTDYGLTWTDLGQQYGQQYVAGFGNLGNGIVIATTGHTTVTGKILRSTDYGLTWTDLGAQGQGTDILLRPIAYCSNGAVILGTNPGGKILRSVNYGVNWTNLGQMGTEAEVYSLIYLGKGIALAGTGMGGKIFRSTNYGLTWTSLGQMFNQTEVFSFAYCGNGIVLAGTGMGGLILRSLDYGATWASLGQQASLTEIRGMFYLGNGIVVAGGSGKILRSLDYGLTWTNLGTQSGETGIQCFTSLEKGIVLAGSGNHGSILRSVGFVNSLNPVGSVAGSGTSGYIPMWDTNISLRDSKLFQGGAYNYIGYNTITPSYALHMIRMVAGSEVAGIGLDIAGTQYPKLQFEGQIPGGEYGTYIGYDYASTPDRMIFKTDVSNSRYEIWIGGLEQIRIDPKGRMGIGRATYNSALDPNAGLDVRQTIKDYTASYKAIQSGLVYDVESAMTNYYGFYSAAPIGTITNKYALVTEVGAGNIGFGTVVPTTLCDLEKQGTVKTLTNLLELTNSGNAPDMDSTGTGILFNQWYYDANVPAVANLARIEALTETDWTSTTSSQDGGVGISTVLDGTLSRKIYIGSSGDIDIESPAGPAYNKFTIVDHSTLGNRAALFVAQDGASNTTGYGLHIAKTGASTTNVAGYFTASGATNNYGLIVAAGNSGFGTTNPNYPLSVAGDAEISGDFHINGNDLFMATNTLGALLIGDGTNFNPVVMSGDASIAADGNITITSGRGGPIYREITLLPDSAVLDDGNPPALTIVESTGTGTARFRVADFDATTDEIVYWTFVVPSDMASGNWYADVSWFSNDTGASETCVWEVFISATSEGDVDSMIEQATGTTNYASEDVNTTEANRLIQTTITLSNLDNVAAGDVVTLRFSRDADSTNTTDDLTSDARLVGIRLRIPRT